MFDKRRADPASEEETLMTEYMRAIAAEAVTILEKYRKITMFREMPNGRQVSIFAQGTMMAVASIVMGNLDKEKGDIEKNTREFLAHNVDVAVENAKEISGHMREMRDALRDLGITDDMVKDMVEDIRAARK